MKRIAILGSTGSIGTQTLDVIRRDPENFSVEVLGANSNDQLLEKQIAEFHPRFAILSDESAYKRLKSRYTGATEILGGRQAFIDSATVDGVDIVVTSMTGFAGLEPTVKAIESGKTIALANKETLVVAGEIITRLARENHVKILPVDSEHCAFFQCLRGEDSKSIEKLLLTASGGPFRGKTREELQNATIDQVLAHPTWNMGKKITVDSASLVNKGLEVIEAKWLYGVDYAQIQVVVHPQSIVHSMVQFRDGSIIAQLGATDMRLPIHYALNFPERVESDLPRLDFWKMKDLTFDKPDLETFRGLKFAYEVGEAGGTLPTTFNAANEIAVGAFLEGRIRFLQIYDVIEETISRRGNKKNPALEDLFAEDLESREVAKSILTKLD